jgi:hypothetical protein
MRPIWRNISLNKPIEEKSNGQGSAEKQPREEKTQAGEGKTDGSRIAVFRPAAEAHDGFFNAQETIAPAKLLLLPSS